MPISNPLLIQGIGSIDLSPLEDRLVALEAENVEQFTAIAALQAQARLPWLIKTANYAAQPGDRIVANGSAGGFTVTLPNNASPGDEVHVLSLGTNAIAVDPGGVNLNGAIAPMQISVDRQETHFIYIGAAGWVAAIGGVPNSGDTGGGSAPSPGGYSAISATLLGSQGMTQIQSNRLDDTLIAIPDIGFDFPYFGNNCRSTLKLSSNSALAFTGSIPSETTINSFEIVGLTIGNRDGQVTNVFVKADSNKYRIRFEGNHIYSDSAINKIWEVTLFADGSIQLVTGACSPDGGSFISNGNRNSLVSSNYTLAANTSYVFTFNNNVITVRNGSYS